MVAKQNRDQLQRFRRDKLSANALPRQRPFFELQNGGAASRCCDRSRRTCRAATDHDEVERFTHASSQSLPCGISYEPTSSPSSLHLFRHAFSSHSWSTLSGSI